MNKAVTATPIKIKAATYPLVDVSCPDRALPIAFGSSAVPDNDVATLLPATFRVSVVTGVSLDSILNGVAVNVAVPVASLVA
jgi:hypothetical protein